MTPADPKIVEFTDAELSGETISEIAAASFP